MTREDVFQRLSQILVEDFQAVPEQLRDECSLRGDLGLDSLALTDLAFLIQSDFGIKASPEVFRDVATLGALADAISRRHP